MKRIVLPALFAVLLCSCGGKEGGPKKSVTAWRVKPSELGVAVTAEGFDRYEKLSAKNDQLQIQQMMLKGELFSVTRNTEVEMLEHELHRSKVRVKNGPQAGKEGFVPTEQVERVFLPD
jgi:hypothetical protein